jgi:hypothetical protein
MDPEYSRFVHTCILNTWNCISYILTLTLPGEWQNKRKETHWVHSPPMEVVVKRVSELRNNSSAYYTTELRSRWSSCITRLQPNKKCS